MASSTVSGGESQAPSPPSPQPESIPALANGNGISNKPPSPQKQPNSEVAVTITQCPNSNSHSDNIPLMLDEDRGSFDRRSLGPFPASTDWDLPPTTTTTTTEDRGLSCLSLDVLTSGEHLDMLSLSSDGSALGSVITTEGPGESEEGRESSLGSSGNGDGDLVPVNASIEQVSHQTPNEGSRSSSSMGYLEPRPLSPPPQAVPNPSPKDIQKKLIEKINILGTDDSDIKKRKGADKEAGISATLPGRSQSMTTSNRLSFGGIFKRKNSLVKSVDRSPQTLAATSTTGLILHDRPKTLPAKSPAEEHKHQRLHQQMMVASRKKDLQKAKEEMKKEKMKRERDKHVADSLKEWERILPKWEAVYNSRKVRDLWWQGLPPGIRGKVWKKAIGNDLHISSDLYVINLRRCRERLAIARDRTDSNTSRTSLSREHSVEVIHLDVLRTFPTLGFFQEGGPYNKPLHDVLGAYACYRPDIGYVQGMSFLAGVLLLNMEAGDAFISLANLLNLPSYLAFFKVDYLLMQPYFQTFNILLQDAIPKLSTHFSNLRFSAEYYLIEWIFTIYTRALPLDVACRVWDLFCRDGDAFLFRTALGILKMFQLSLLDHRSIEELGQFLGKLPSTIESESLFAHIESIHFTTKRFTQILSQQQQQQQETQILTTNSVVN